MLGYLLRIVDRRRSWKEVIAVELRSLGHAVYVCWEGLRKATEMAIQLMNGRSLKVGTS